MPRKGVLHHQWQKKMDTKMSDHVNEKIYTKFVCLRKLNNHGVEHFQAYFTKYFGILLKLFFLNYV